ncbi:MAG: ABC transporter substrate-binding protein [bacterium]
MERRLSIIIFGMAFALSLSLILAISPAEMKYKEAPMLAEMVKAGKLPPVEERLPKEPLVLKPLEEIGQYGGTWRRAWLGPSDSPGPDRITYDPILRFDREGKDVIPGASKGWEFTEGGKVLTLYLREGMRWSDGAPFTADDVIFWYEDIILNDELTPSKPSWFKVGGELGKVEKVDDYTIRLSFSQPYGILLEILAWNGYIFAPKHYLKEFHPRYVPKGELEKLAKKSGYEFWHQLFTAKNNWIQNPDLPTIRAWKPINPPTEPQWTMERNPYYWKVDTEGNQLPYIDRVVHNLVENAEVINLKAMAGELDFQLRHLLVSNYTVFMENREKGDYRVLAWKSGFGADIALYPNLDYTGDPVLRDLINDRRFRIALSVAINREEINELVFLGLGEPRAATVPPQSPGYKEEFARMHAEYDPNKANKLLDEMGLAKRDAEGFRLRPDGKTLTLTIEVVPVFGPWVDVCELVKEHWEAVGIKTAVKTEERSLFYTRTHAGEQQVQAWSHGQVFRPLLNPFRLIPYSMDTPFAPLTGLWYQTRGKSGVEPKGDLRKAIDLYERAKLTVDEGERNRLTEEMIRLSVENVWAIGTVGLNPGVMSFGVAKNNFRNVPEVTISDTLLSSPGNTDPAQYFFKRR